MDKQEMVSQYKKNLASHILPHSESQDVIQAILEWGYTGKVMDNQTKQGYCMACGHRPIRHSFYIKNKKNGNTLIVGSECVLLWDVDAKAEMKLLEIKTKQEEYDALKIQESAKKKEDNKIATYGCRRPDGSIDTDRSNLIYRHNVQSKILAKYPNNVLGFVLPLANDTIEKSKIEEYEKLIGPLDRSKWVVVE